MTPLTNQFRRLRESEPDIAAVLDAYAEMEGVYREALEVISVPHRQEMLVGNSARVTMSFRGASTSS